MHNHHNPYVNFVVATVVGTVPIWMVAFEGVSWFAERAAPIIALTVGCVQLYLLLRKLRHKPHE